MASAARLHGVGGFLGTILVGVSLALIKLLDTSIGVRVGEQGEVEGLDLSQHGERGYNL